MAWVFVVVVIVGVLVWVWVWLGWGGWRSCCEREESILSAVGYVRLWARSWIYLDMVFFSLCSVMYWFVRGCDIGLQGLVLVFGCSRGNW